MVEIGQNKNMKKIQNKIGFSGPIQKIGFENPKLKAVGVDVLTLHELRERASPTLKGPQRVEFYFLMLIQQGQCRHTIDFVDFELKPGAVVFLRPGQVQQWHMNDDMQGLIVLIANESMSPSIGRFETGIKLLSLDQWPSGSKVSMGLFLLAYSDAMRLRNEVQNFGASEREIAIIWYTTIALLLRLALELRIGETAQSRKRDAEIYRLFSKEVESGFHKHLTVADYAKRLGYSLSTLQRACVSIVQHGAKSTIDNRLILEAKRLLVHTDASTVDIGYQLGFIEPSNFVKFFKRLSGTTPQQYRKQQRQIEDK